MLGFERMTAAKLSGDIGARSVARLAAWPGWTSTLASAFVVGCLVVLAIAPLWLNRHMEGLRLLSSQTTERAAQLSAQLRYTLAEEVTAHQEFRASPNARNLADYRSTRVAADSLLQQLTAVAATIDPSASRLNERTTRIVREWQAPQDARANGAIDDAKFETLRPQLRALSDSLRDAQSSFDAYVAGVETDRERAGASTIARQEVLILGLGLLAIVAGVTVAALGLRERRLAHALSLAFQRERRLRAQSEQRREDLERMTESKNRLMRGFTHDVKNPLGAADGFLSLMQDELHGPLTPQQRDALARVRRSLRTALTLVTDLLEMARAESGRIAFRFEAVDLCALVADVADEFRGQAEAKGLELCLSPGCALPEVDTDPTRLREVLGNLVSNAVKYTDHGRVEIRTDGGTDGVACIAVADTGHGIAADNLDQLFREFVRFEPAAAEGAGIGLAMTKKIVEAMGATISVRSELGRGSVFSVHLPIRGRRVHMPAVDRRRMRSGS